MKRVLIMVPSLHVGGMERMLVNVANVLVAGDCNVTVINMTSDDSEIVNLLDRRVNYKNNYCPVKNIFHTRLRDWYKWDIRILPFKYWTKFHSSRYLHDKYIKEKYDTEIAFYTGYCVKIISGCSSDTRKIFWLHSEVRELGGMMQGFWTRKSSEAIYKSFSPIICVSQSLEIDLHKQFGDDCTTVTISNINDVEDIKNKAVEKFDIPKTNITFVAVGRVNNQQKGFDRILEATRILNQEKFQFTLWVVGDGCDFHKLQELKQEFNLENVVLWGMQENPYKFINNADILICSSHFEAYGLVVSEALILGKPVMSTNVSGPAEILDNGKFGMIVNNNIEGIYCGMKSFLEHPENIHRYQVLAKARADFFDTEKISKQILSVV